MSERVSLTLPWPPSVNRHVRAVGGRVIVSKEWRAYRANVAAEVGLRSLTLAMRGALGVEMVVYPPNYQRRDGDNLLKAVYDALSFANVVADDAQFRELYQRWECPARPGRIELTLWPLGYDLAEWRERCRERRRR